MSEEDALEKLSDETLRRLLRVLKHYCPAEKDDYESKGRPHNHIHDDLLYLLAVCVVQAKPELLEQGGDDDGQV